MLLYVVYVAKQVLWRLQKAMATKSVLMRKINHMHICRTESHTVQAVARNERKLVKNINLYKRA